MFLWIDNLCGGEELKEDFWNEREHVLSINSREEKELNYFVEYDWGTLFFISDPKNHDPMIKWRLNRVDIPNFEPV